MALTKISRSLLDTGISDSSDATAITIDSSENIFLSNTTSLIGVNTSDGSDNKSVMVNGGGAASSSRGAYVWAKGNEHSSDAGFLQLTSGTVSGAAITMFTNGSERMRIASSGELGLGVTANHTGGSGDINMKGNQAIRWMHSTDGTQYGDMYVDTSSNMVFRNTSSSTERMRIDSSGNVGIGTTSPDEKLDVAGNVVVNNGGFYKFGDGTVRIYGETSSDIMSFVTNDSERMRIDSSGYLYVGTTSRIISGVVNVENVGAANCFTGKVSNNAYYNFAGSNSSGTTTFYVKGDGDYYFAGTSQSDKDLKENIQPITESSLAKVKLLEPKTFNFKASEGYATNTKTGFIAQEVAEIFGTETGVASGTDGQKDMGIDTTGIVAHLTKAMQEQQEQIEALQSEINTLKGG